MYIENISLSNYRGFAELSLDIPQDLCVLIGVNGSGKSTILEAISILLELFTATLTKETIQQKLSFDDISFGQKATNLAITSVIDYKDNKSKKKVASFS
ncbi:AAA family ATPase [Spirulina subsalsa FACHB-351]|uniref:AAA family ATPase n=1 Tax=Spirulina subsalsa FACHB-351 TaxID=234711 RepID=A0ABT3L589_9CYAN|nr:AAA family ATPase [Spirulina subsalsa]MCW6036671.1 AAA family ATPase [Spirulina subsalsa FACHB-351]